MSAFEAVLQDLATQSSDTNPFEFISEAFAKLAEAHSQGDVFEHGHYLLGNSEFNRGLAFTNEERACFKIRGLLPPGIATMAEQEARALWNLSQKEKPLDKYIYLQNLALQNQRLYYRVLVNNITDFLPVVYTPTVGLACQEFAHIFSRPYGIYVTINDLGNVRSILSNWRHRDVRAIVFTDGERILGLGDLGVSGMGIPVGKLALYTACAGVPPEKTLPVCLDVGTDNKKFLDDPLYFGLRHTRVRGERYDALVLEFMQAAEELFGHDCILQFEDFANQNAFRLLEMHRNNFLTFNDDIQGTASVVLAGFVSAAKTTGVSIDQQTVLFYGAGSAGIGIAELMAVSMHLESKISLDQARARIWFMDSKGLIHKGRATGGINHEKAPFAHSLPEGPAFDITNLTEVIRHIRPSALVGVSAQGGVFTNADLKLMGEINARPIIFPLSNPTSKAECTAQDAYEQTSGRCVFASGSPFAPVTLEGKTYFPGQGNNSYIFPGLALGIMVAKARRVPDILFIVAAQCLADFVTPEERESGRIYPDMKRIRAASTQIAFSVANYCYLHGLAHELPQPADLMAAVKAFQYITDCYPSSHRHAPSNL